MAATNVYASIKRVPFGNVSLDEKIEFTNIQATPNDFWLSGGYYGVDVIAATFGTVTFTKRGPNGSTYLSLASTLAFSANGSIVPVLLGPGHYRMTIA
jgi:hypothetical protein